MENLISNVSVGNVRILNEPDETEIHTADAKDFDILAHKVGETKVEFTQDTELDGSGDRGSDSQGNQESQE